MHDKHKDQLPLPQARWWFGLIIFICNYEKQRGWATSSLNISYAPLQYNTKHVYTYHVAAANKQHNEWLVTVSAEMMNKHWWTVNGQRWRTNIYTLEQFYKKLATLENEKRNKMKTSDK